MTTPLRGSLRCVLDQTAWPVRFNSKGYLEVIREHVEPETFSVRRVSHPAIGGETAFEFRALTGGHLAGGEQGGLTLAEHELDEPGPAFRVHHRGETDIENMHYVKLQTLDTRWVAVSGRRTVDRGWSWFSIKVPQAVPITIADREAHILRMLEPGFAAPATFVLALEEAEA